MKINPILALMVLLISPPEILSANKQRNLIQNRGSDSMAIAVVGWAEQYKRENPAVGVAVSGGGTGTGIAALINGSVDVANASREMSRREIDLAKKRGMAPAQHIVGYDAVAIYVHKDNPVESLTFSQLADIYGAGGKTESWSDLGIHVPGCSSQKIVRVSRQNSSGTHAYLRRNILGGKIYKHGTLEAQASKDLVRLVVKTPCAIGYSSFAYATPEVKVACVAEGPDQPCSKPSVEGVTKRTYLISRPLFMYTDGPATGDVKDYLDWVLSDAGQCVLLKRRYAPVREVSCED